MHVIQGGRAPLVIGSCAIDVCAPGSPDSERAADAVVLEEDRYLLLSAAARVNLDDPAHARGKLRTLTNGFGAEPAELGTLVLRQGRPIELLAVVVDIDIDAREAPQSDPAHVIRAWSRVLAVCRAQSLRAVRAPLLGVRGRLAVDVAARALADAASAPDAGSAHIALVCDERTHDRVRAVLADAAAKNSVENSRA
jgi:hypothetical protein